MRNTEVSILSEIIVAYLLVRMIQGEKLGVLLLAVPQKISLCCHYLAALTETHARLPRGERTGRPCRLIRYSRVEKEKKADITRIIKKHTTFITNLMLSFLIIINKEKYLGEEINSGISNCQ